MCAAFPTKRPRTSGSKTRVGGKNGAVNRNGVVNKYCVLRKNDALNSNDVRHNAATAPQPTRGRAKPNGPNARHTLETCAHYFQSMQKLLTGTPLGLRYVVGQRVQIVEWLQQNQAFSIANRDPSHYYRSAAP